VIAPPPEPAIVAKPIIPLAQFERQFRFGENGEVKTIDAAYRHCLGAKRAMRLCLHRQPLPFILDDAQVSHERPLPTQSSEMSTASANLHKFGGMMIRYDGEFKVWQAFGLEYESLGEHCSI